jgi:integrase
LVIENIPENSPVWVSFSRCNKGQPIVTKTLSHLCEWYLDTPKVHALRHTFSVGMMRSGPPITELAGRLGHTDIKITAIYAKEILKDENRHAEKLTARFGIKRKGKL